MKCRKWTQWLLPGNTNSKIIYGWYSHEYVILTHTVYTCLSFLESIQNPTKNHFIFLFLMRYLQETRGKKYFYLGARVTPFPVVHLFKMCCEIQTHMMTVIFLHICIIPVLWASLVKQENLLVFLSIIPSSKASTTPIRYITTKYTTTLLTILG